MTFALTPELAESIISAMENQNDSFVVDAATGSLLYEDADGIRADDTNYYSLPEWSSADGFNLRESFTSKIYSPIVQEELQDILHSGRGVFKNFKNALKKYPEIDKRWHIYKHKIMSARINEWYNSLREIWGLEKLDYLDTMEISKVITLSKEYQDYCIYNKEYGKIINKEFESDFITNSGRVRTTAQAIYSYIVKNPEFQEQHTALEDIDIEIEIFKESMKLKPIIILNKKPHFSEFPKIV